MKLILSRIAYLLATLIIWIILIFAIYIVFATFGLAADKPEHTISVTVDDITAVAEQIGEYDTEIDMLARLVYAEARGVSSKTEQAAVIWCVLNRVDHQNWSDTITGVVKARGQFAYSSRTQVTEEFKALATDVVTRWLLEKRGVTDVGRVLPPEYTYFAGRRGHNWFRTGYRTRRYWDWSLQSPYEDITDESAV